MEKKEAVRGWAIEKALEYIVLCSQIKSHVIADKITIDTIIADAKKIEKYVEGN